MLGIEFRQVFALAKLEFRVSWGRQTLACALVAAAVVESHLKNAGLMSVAVMIIDYCQASLPSYADSLLQRKTCEENCSPGFCATALNIKDGSIIQVRKGLD